MGRPSKLNEAQWVEIERERLKGVPYRTLAKKYGVSASAIRERVSAQSTEIKEVANQVIEAERRFKELPISAQISAQTLIDDLRAVSTHLASAAKYGSMTAHRLAGYAHAETEKIDDAAPLANPDTLSGISALTRMANQSSEIGLNLLRANKDFVDEVNQAERAKDQGPKKIIREIVRHPS